MEISIHSLLEGATRATGTVAIIDVFRAFTTAAVALANGASSIVMVRTVEEALALRDAGFGQICMGEVRGRPPDRLWPCRGSLGVFYDHLSEIIGEGYNISVDGNHPAYFVIVPV